MFIVHLPKFEIRGLSNSTFVTSNFDFDSFAVFLSFQTDDGLTSDQSINPVKGKIH